MPVAGPRAEDRAAAHYRWAERYDDKGADKKAAAHFGRALDYSDEASFGVPAKRTQIKPNKVDTLGMRVKPTAKFKSEPKLGPCYVCRGKATSWYRDQGTDKYYRLCSMCGGNLEYEKAPGYDPIDALETNLGKFSLVG